MPRWASEESKTRKDKKKNISMGFETWERLKTFGVFGDSFDDILNRLMDYREQQPQLHRHEINLHQLQDDKHEGERQKMILEQKQDEEDTKKFIEDSKREGKEMMDSIARKTKQDLEDKPKKLVKPTRKT